MQVFKHVLFCISPVPYPRGPKYSVLVSLIGNQPGVTSQFGIVQTNCFPFADMRLQHCIHSVIALFTVALSHALLAIILLSLLSTFPHSCLQPMICLNSSSLFFVSPRSRKSFNYFLGCRIQGGMPDVLFHPHFKTWHLSVVFSFSSGCFGVFGQFFTPYS